ncbi:hypothetical protein AAFC00_004190 [Neodothiora populina]|uniref:Zn(2)-C6 fungal-type domain-containing protein n=1 Tax=Neodothiora populina TaxID=2781224 RepID=A0ABR3PJ71_9PEZI
MNPTNAPKKKRPNQQANTNDPENNEGASDTGANTSPISGANGSSAISSSNFRNVSACNRCRLRKNRCDQKLPACTSCEKANVKCVGFDPVSKREIPRSYVYYLESRVQHLESLLQKNNVDFAPADDFTLSVNSAIPQTGDSNTKDASNGAQQQVVQHEDEQTREQQNHKKLTNLVHNVGLVSVQGASDNRYLGSTSGISFARVVFAAVKSSISGNGSDRGGVRPSKPLGGATGVGGTTMRDSFFGLHTKPAIKPAPFPRKETAQALVELYFEHSNPQIPVLHRGEYMDLFERCYATDEKKRTPRELYFLNIICAIGSGIIMDTSDSGQNRSAGYGDPSDETLDEAAKTKENLPDRQTQPEEYHSSAIIHLESFLGSSPAAEGFGGGLEELQAVLLLAGFALLRPVAPGLWYIVGVAVRLAVDLGLHNEDPEAVSELNTEQHKSDRTALEIEENGRREWIRDLRRRLWWCVYSFDRLVSICVGRPVGITDQVITTEFPTLRDDRYISPRGFLTPPPDAYSSIPSYKHVSYHYFRLRLLQSEILQVLQHRQTQQVRERGVNATNQWMHVGLPSPFLQKHGSFREWRSDVDKRLWEWIQASPTQTMAGVAFSPLFLELNYWQTVIMLYRQSLSVPPSLAGELDASTGDDVTSPGHVDYEEEGDEEMVFLKVAEAGQKVLKIYRQLHRVRLVNYTFLATHHLFMCGISFLYAIWHSVVVRSKLTLDDVDFTVLAATSVLDDLISKCGPAEACRDAFDRMAKATIAMAMKETGFGQDALRHLPERVQNSTSNNQSQMKPPQYTQDEHNMLDPNLRQQTQQRQKRPAPRFDMDLKDLFSDDEYPSRASKLRRTQYQPTHSPSTAIKREPSGTFSTTSSVPPQMSTHGPYRQQQTTSPHMYSPSTPVDPSLQTQTRPTPSTSPSQHQQQERTYFANVPNYTVQQQQRQQRQQQQQQQQQQSQRQQRQQLPPSQQQQEGYAYPGASNAFDSLDFLENFPAAGPHGEPMHGAVSADHNGAGGFPDYDLGFGVGGLSFDGGAGPSWDESGGFDLFDGFFFGGGAGHAGG